MTDMLEEFNGQPDEEDAVLDTTPIGVSASDLMEKVQHAFGDNGRIGAIGMVAEVIYKDEDGDECTSVIVTSTESRPWVRAAFFRLAEEVASDWRNGSH
jgi:hypothetical protein